jgi:hypothetical protein
LQLGLWISLARPLAVRQFLALAGRLGHLCQHFAIGPAISRRTIVRSAALASIVEASTSIRLPLGQASLGHQLLHPAEHRLVELMGKPPASFRQPRVIGNLLAILQP